MPTSGGGGHGGFGGGGSFHSSGGGGYRGGRGPRLSTFWFFAPHYYYRRGFGVLIAPVICLIIVFALIGLLLFAAVGVSKNKQIAYSEDTAEQYAMKQYQQAFGNEHAYEDKILLVFFPYENREDYDYIAMIGDDLTNAVYNSLRGDRSELNDAMKQYISSINYETALGRNLSSVVDDLSARISTYGNPYRASCKDTLHVEGDSYLRNESDLTIDQEMVDQSLAAFTETTGVEFVIVVEDAAEVFGYQSIMPLIVVILILLVIAGAIIFAVVRGMRARKNHQNNRPGSSGGYQTGADFDGNPKTDFSDGDNW